MPKKTPTPAAQHKFADRVGGRLKYYQKRYEAGDKTALLTALWHCLAMDILVPGWVRANINAALSSYWRYDAATLDEAFGTKRRDPRRIESERKAYEIASEVWQYLWSETDAGKSRNEDLFEQAAEKYGISKTRAKEYWRRVNAEFGTEPPNKKTKRPAR